MPELDAGGMGPASQLGAPGTLSARALGVPEVPSVELTSPKMASYVFRGWARPSAAAPGVPMYGPAGPVVSDIAQGDLGDCVKIAVAGSIVALSPDTMSRRLYTRGDKVIFAPYSAALGVPIIHEMTPTVPRFLKRSWGVVSPLGARVAGSAWWLPMYEKGLALASYHSIRPMRNAQRDGPRSRVEALAGYDSLSYATPPNSAAEIMTQLTGRPSVIHSDESVSDMTSLEFHHLLRQITSQSRPCTSGFYGIPEATLTASLLLGVVDYHAYWIEGYDPVHRTVQLHNPWGRRHVTLPLKAYKAMAPTLIVGDIEGVSA